MSLNTVLRSMITAATVKYQEGTCGIIPFNPAPELDPHDAAVYTVVGMINDALTGPAIGAYELAEGIVGEVSVKTNHPILAD